MYSKNSTLNTTCQSSGHCDSLSSRSEAGGRDSREARRVGGARPSVPAAGGGLSQTHISAQVEYVCFASEVKVRIPVRHPIKRGIRGRITGFSKASAARLRETCHRVRRDQLPLFTTLTYPGDFPTDAETWKRHLDSFDRALDRVGRGKLGAIWKLEPQRRGAPHYHLLVWGVRNFKRFRQWVALTWYRIVGSGDERHLRAGTQVDQIRSHRGVMAYASKYFTKLVGSDCEGWDFPGRCWGILNRKAIPWGDVVVADVTAAFAHRLKRWLRRATGYTYVSHYGQKFWLESPESWFLRLDEQLSLSPP